MSEPTRCDRESIVGALKTVHDPEIPVNLFDLGLIYSIEIDDRRVSIQMTLTTPNCPVAEQMPQMVQAAVAGVSGVDEVEIDLVWEPAWTSDRMTEDAKLTLEMMGIEWSDPHRSVMQQKTRPNLTIGRTDRGA